MLLVKKPTQFGVAPASRSAATPSCCGCCCCCCCVATVVAAPIINGGVGAKLAARHGQPVKPAKIAATLAAIPLMFFASSLGFLVNLRHGVDLAYLLNSVLTLLLVGGAAVAGIMYSAKATAVAPRVAVGWSFGFMLLSGVALGIEGAIALLLFESGDSFFLYVLIPLMVIPLAVVWRSSAVRSAESISERRATITPDEDAPR